MSTDAFDRVASTSFGDTVRVCLSPETTASGHAGRTGTVYGQTVPSLSGVSVIGPLERDYAVNVWFEEDKRDAWFAEQLVEFVDHGAGAEITIKGRADRIVREADGPWTHIPSPKGENKSFWRRLVSWFGDSTK